MALGGWQRFPSPRTLVIPLVYPYHILEVDIDHAAATMKTRVDGVDLGLGSQLDPGADTQSTTTPDEASKQAAERKKFPLGKVYSEYHGPVGNQPRPVENPGTASTTTPDEASKQAAERKKFPLGKVYSEYHGPVGNHPRPVENPGTASTNTPKQTGSASTNTNPAFVLAKQKEKCPTGTDIEDAKTCKKAYDTLNKDPKLFTYPSKRGLQESPAGGWPGVPPKCSIQLQDNAEELDKKYVSTHKDQSPHFNSYSGSDDHRLKKGEFRAICRGSTTTA